MDFGLYHIRNFFCVRNTNNTDLFRQKARHLGTLNQDKIIYFI